MKKGWKIFWITCGALAGLGIILCCVAVAFGVSMHDITDRYPYGIGFMEGGKTKEWPEFKDISELSVDVGPGQLIIEEHDSDGILVEATNITRKWYVDCNQDEGELEIKTKGRFKGNNAGTIHVYLPKGQRYDEADLTVDAGRMEVDVIEAQTLNISVGAGEAIVKDFRARDFVAEAGAGKADMTGQATNIYAHCGVGELSLQVKGAETDYNYDLRCAIGQIRLGSDRYSGLANDRVIDNHKNQEMSVDCGIGQVNVDFVQE